MVFGIRFDCISQSGVYDDGMALKDKWPTFVLIIHNFNVSAVFLSSFSPLNENQSNRIRLSGIFSSFFGYICVIRRRLVSLPCVALF